MGTLEAHVCEMCDDVTLTWWLVQNAHGQRHYFCDTDCIAQWHQRLLTNVAREVVLECQDLSRQ